MKTLLRLSILATSLFLTWGCGSQTDVPNELVFWHVMTQENARLLEEIVDDYNASNPPMPVSRRRRRTRLDSSVFFCGDTRMPVRR